MYIDRHLCGHNSASFCSIRFTTGSTMLLSLVRLYVPGTRVPGTSSWFIWNDYGSLLAPLSPLNQRSPLNKMSGAWTTPVEKTLELDSERIPLLILSVISLALLNFLFSCWKQETNIFVLVRVHGTCTNPVCVETVLMFSGFLRFCYCTYSTTYG